MLLAVFRTAGLSFSDAQANIMSAKMTMATDEVMSMFTDSDFGKMAADAMKGDCNACLTHTGDKAAGCNAHRSASRPCSPSCRRNPG